MVLACASPAGGCIQFRACVLSPHTHWAGARPQVMGRLLTAQRKPHAVVSCSRLQYELVTDVRRSMCNLTPYAHFYRPVTSMKESAVPTCLTVARTLCTLPNVSSQPATYWRQRGWKTEWGHGNSHGWPLVPATREGYKLHSRTRRRRFDASLPIWDISRNVAFARLSCGVGQLCTRRAHPFVQCNAVHDQYCLPQ